MHTAQQQHNGMLVNLPHCTTTAQWCTSQSTTAQQQHNSTLVSLPLHNNSTSVH